MIASLILAASKPLIMESFWRFPVDTGRKLNVHKTFRRRPGRLLNVLCTFNLRPASYWVEMIVCLKNPPSLKRFQITQFEGDFNITRCSSIWQLFANSISIPCVKLVWDKFLCWLIDANIQRLELVREIVWNDNQLTVILCI